MKFASDFLTEKDICLIQKSTDRGKSYHLPLLSQLTDYEWTVIT
jgi:hypothetical protein